MDKEQVLEHFRAAGALLEGHFILSSGLHSAQYLQCARVLADPARAALLCKALKDNIEAGIGQGQIELVVAPAMGGVVVGYEMARQLGVKAIFVERVEGRFELRRGFEIPGGAKILMAEDIVTTGLSSRECIECIDDLGGKVVAASCLIDRSNGRADVSVPLYSLAGLEVAAFAEDDIPDWLKAIPAEKPGSRNLKK
jgi:orotate phosphoribosyltransferase